MTPPGARLVLLGASNLTRDLPLVLDIVRRAIDSAPIQVLAAAGHGRCYGTASRYFLRALPSILECGIWPAIRDSPHQPTHALLTDVGNDFMQGSSVAEIAGWVEACTEGLRRLGAKVVVTTLPEQSLARLRPWQFLLFRTLLYPGRRLGLAEVRQQTIELNARLNELEARHEIYCVQPDAAWFGADAIHLRRRARQLAWGRMLAAWNLPQPDAPRELRTRPSRRRLVPERRSILGRELRRAQPCVVFHDGSTVSLF